MIFIGTPFNDMMYHHSMRFDNRAWRNIGAVRKKLKAVLSAEASSDTLRTGVMHI
jgi:hypothetical protein